MVKTATSLLGLAGTLILTGVALKTLEKLDPKTKRNKLNPKTKMGFKRFKVPNIQLVRDYGKKTPL